MTKLTWSKKVLIKEYDEHCDQTRRGESGEMPRNPVKSLADDVMSQKRQVIKDIPNDGQKFTCHLYMYE